VTLRPRESVSRSLRIKATALPGPEPKSQLALVDISDRVAAEAALREAKDTLERTVAARTTELEQLRQLRQEAALAGERERRELSVLLHDSVGQLLPLANTKVALAKRSSDEATRAKLEEIERIIHEAHTTATSLTHRLNPPVIHEIGLEAGLHALSRELLRDWDVRVVVEGGGSEAMLSDAVRFAVYRVVRELLLNVAKHAGSDQARVTLRGSRSFLDVTVEDDGHGFLPERSRGPGLGLETADEQLRYLGGRMQIRSEPGQGTRVTLRVPCIAPNSDAPEEP
jgi:signal transduction histidine kinase